MSGKKGRSGRRPWEKEVEIKKVVQLSWQLLKWALNAPEDKVPLEKKLEIANKIGTKSMPSEIFSKQEISMKSTSNEEQERDGIINRLYKGKTHTPLVGDN